MRIVLCDDDSEILIQLRHDLDTYFRNRNYVDYEIQTYSCGEDLLNDTEPIHLCFLDIEMDGIDGIYVGRQLQHKYPKCFIFIITSYMEYLDDAMRFHVFRYLNKPLNKQRLWNNLDDAMKEYLHNTQTITFKTIHRTLTLPLSAIVMIEAQGRKSIVSTIYGVYESPTPMREWIDRLDPEFFFEPHRGYLVNLYQISSFDHDKIHLWHDQYHAYLAKRRYADFKRKYLLFLEESE